MGEVKAIVTIALGEKYSKLFDEICLDNWKQYADKHGYDLICIKEPLDQTQRAMSRSPAWQKCLILSQEWSDKYSRIVWIDSDILINPDSPDISVEVPIEKVGATDEYSSPSSEIYVEARERVHEYKRINGIGGDYTPDLYAAYGFSNSLPKIVQTGVMVLSPKYHRKYLESVYYNYEDRGFIYEMVPLSYELITNNIVHWISPKFNTLWIVDKAYYYPFLLCNSKRKNLLKECLSVECLNSYFLHFAGGLTGEMKYVQYNSTKDILIRVRNKKMVSIVLNEMIWKIRNALKRWH